MRERLKLFGYFAAFWLGFQVIIRAIFMVYNYTYTSTLKFTEFLKVFLYGLKMDMSMAGYYLMLTGILLGLSSIIKRKKFYLAYTVITIIILLLSSIIVTVDMELYRHWGFRMNTTPLFYMGSEAVGSVSIFVVLRLILIFVVLFSLSLLVYAKFIAPKVKQLQPVAFKKAIPLFFLAAFMFLPIRGSFTVAPMNTGFVYFHPTNAFANHAAINVVWNFLYSLRKSANLEYPENFYDKNKAVEKFESLYVSSDSTIQLFNTNKPNIILFILESFTADVIEPLGGMKDIAPNLNRYCSEGVLFDNFYSSGDRTDKGIISVLSGYPAQPATSIIKYPAKTQHLSFLNHHMNRLGYNTSFVYGGDIDFANFRSYITNCQFDYITTEEDFPSEENESKWGVHDHLVLTKAMQETDTTATPFFKVILTLSSHEPFDVPMKPRIKGMDEQSLFLNSCFYTDRSIGTFIEEARKKNWWKNTVVIFVADHGHRHPGNKQAKDKEKFKIPLLMIGGAVKKDTVIHTYGSQTDIANTLLAQLDKPYKEFKFSKNLLDPKVKSFAAYFFNDGYGFLTPDAYLVFDNAGKQFMQKTGSEEVIETSKAYQQILYSDYNKK